MSNINLWIAGGTGTSNTMAYSSNGTQWTGLGKSIFSTCYSIAYNGVSLLVAAGYYNSVGSNKSSLAYSSNGTSWVGLGTTIFSGYGQSIGYGNNLWVAGGSNTGGTTTIAYSSDGQNWTPILNSSSITTTLNYVKYFSTIGKWIGVGGLPNTIIYSINGTQWTGLGSAIFSTFGGSISYYGGVFIAGGQGTNNYAYSMNGTQWVGLGLSSVISTLVSGFGYLTANSLAYSTNGTTWVGLGNNILGQCSSIVYNGNNVWVAGGKSLTLGQSNLAYSTNGTVWIGLGNIFGTSGICNCISYGSNKWLAVGSSTTYSIYY